MDGAPGAPGAEAGEEVMGEEVGPPAAATGFVASATSFGAAGAADAGVCAGGSSAGACVGGVVGSARLAGGTDMGGVVWIGQEDLRAILVARALHLRRPKGHDVAAGTQAKRYSSALCTRFYTPVVQREISRWDFHFSWEKDWVE